MHDIRTIRADGAGFDAALARRGALAVSDDLLARDASRRAAQTALQDKQARRNAIAKQIGENRRKGIDTAALESESTALRDEMAALEQSAAALDADNRATLERLPHILDPDVPDGRDETANMAVKQVGHLRNPQR